MTRKPVGVVGVITPFNFPIAIPAWKIAPALIYGNTVVWKPASTVPLLAMRLAQALTRRGAARRGAQPGHRRLATSVTASSTTPASTPSPSPVPPAIGRRIAAAAAARGVPVQCEMGGKNAAIVLDDADLDLAAGAGHARRVPLHRPKVHRHFAIDPHRRDRRAVPRSRWRAAPTR